jgi:anaphase-promoting complex subunit 6
LYDEKKYLNCILESMLLACDCYGSFGEWEEVMNILDDACQYETIMVTGDIDVNDSDGIHGYEPPGWAITTEEERKILALARYLHGNELQASVSPVARLAFMRGRACDESANPIRASCFLKLALFIDVKCVDAWLYLCQRRLMTSEEELEMVTCLKFEDSEMEWLKDIFYARLSLSEHVLEEENKSAFMNAGAGLFRESIGSPISSSVLPHFQSTPQINIDTSAIHFQPTPGTPFNFIGANQAKGLSSKQKAIGKSSKNVEIKKQVEQSFQNLYQKHDLSHSPDILALAATRAFNSYNLALALHYCQILYERDPLCTSAASIQIATLAALGHKRPLFRLAHALVDADSKSGTAWYAVGCYYYACGKYDLSQQYFWRATRLDPRNAECWIAFGCAFAACDENDQANACFRSAQRLHSGSHYPMLYIGMEHLRTNNIPLAGHFLKSAMSMESSDPLCANELGVWAYRKKDWNEAITWFTLALRLYVEADISEKDSLAWHEDDLSVQQGSDVKNYRPRFEFGHRTSKEIVHSLTDRDCVEFCQEAFWEPTLFNLGQSYRKNRQFEDAIHCFEKCISICPENCMPFAALGFTRHLIGDLDGAIEAYHQALSRKSDDPFAQEMLDKALEESMNMCGLFDGDDELHNSCMKTRHSPLVPSKDSFVRHNMSTIDDAEESNITFGDSTSDIDMSMT